MFDSFLFQYSVSYVLGGTIFALLAIFVLSRSPKELLNRIFAFYCLCITWWSAFSILMINAPTEFWGTFWDRLCLMGVIFIPPSFVHFNFILLRYDLRHRSFIIANYLLCCFFFVLNLTPFFVSHTSPKFGLNFYTDPGLGYLPFVVYFFSLSILTILTLFLSQRKATGNYKKQISLLFWASLLGYSLGGNNYNLSFGIGPAILAAVGNIGVVVYGLIVAYIITKHRLMDLSVVISRTVAEFWAIAFHGVIYLGMVWLYHNHISTTIDLPFIAGTVVYGILVGQTHQSLRLFIQTTSDKVFLHGKYNYYNTLASASSHVGEKLSLPDILNVLYDTFLNVVEIANPRIYLPEYFTEANKISDRYLIYDKTTHHPHPEMQEIKNDASIIQELITKREPRHNVINLDAALIVPCLLEDRLIALFVFGSKLSEDPYTDEDIRLLQALASQVAVALDHTRSYEKIKADLESAERQLERSQRLASIGTLTAGVTHEIRNPLTAIRGETERLNHKLRDEAYLKSYQELVLRNITRIENIVERMLGLARQKPKQNVPVDLNEQIINVLPLIPLIPLKNVRLKKELLPLPPVNGDPEGLQEVFINIIQNAVQAMPEGGELTVRSYPQDKNAIVEIMDTGKGIPVEIQERIFDPFFSTRHEGVGLGLSIVYKIIREHGGDIKVSSEPGKGTTFKIIL